MLKRILKYGLEFALKRYSRSHHSFGSYRGYKKPYYKKRKKFKLKDLFD